MLYIMTESKTVIEAEVTIEQGNTLIDIFYEGRELMPGKKSMGHKRGSPKQYENWYDTIDVKSLKYHSSWDWLMPVVEKIELLYDGGISVIIKDTRCFMEFSTQLGMTSKYENFELPQLYSGFC